MNKLKASLSLFLTMFKIGLFTFGGGYAMLALLENEFVENSVILTFADMSICIPLDSMVDSNAEKERIEKEILRLNSEIERSEKLLANEGFVAKAPAKLIEAEKEKLAKNKALKAELEK